MRTSFGLALVFSLTLCACGGAGDPVEAGYDALRDGKSAEALEFFDKALSGMTEGADGYKEVAVARCEAMVGTDAAAAAQEFITLSSKDGSGVDMSDFGLLISAFYSNKSFLEAVPVLDAGLKKFPGNETLETHKKTIIAEAAKGDNPALQDTLKGLGYL